MQAEAIAGRAKRQGETAIFCLRGASVPVKGCEAHVKVRVKPARAFFGGLAAVVVWVLIPRTDVSDGLHSHHHAAIVKRHDNQHLLWRHYLAHLLAIAPLLAASLPGVAIEWTAKQPPYVVLGHAHLYLVYIACGTSRF